jgi:5'-3' exonuclease
MKGHNKKIVYYANNQKNKGEKMSYILIVDGNLFARKMFYKFKHLSSKLSPQELGIISPIFQKNILAKLYVQNQDNEIFNKQQGVTVKITDKRIGERIKQITAKNTEIKIKTGIAYGVLRSLISLCKSYDISKMVFCYDPQNKNRAKHYRFFLDKGYKAYRDKRSIEKVAETMDFYEQLKLSQHILHNIGIKQTWTEMYEADDLLQYYANKVYKKKRCLILTNDHDLFQILNPLNSLIDIGKNPHLFTWKNFNEKFGIMPKQWLDVMSLCGCSGDDVKGLPGIGEKIAINLIKEFETIENLLKSYRKDENSVLTSKIIKILNNDRKRNFSEIKHTRKLVKLYGLNFIIDKEFTEKKKGGDIKRVISILSCLKFKSLLGKEQIKILKTVIKKQKGE